MTPINKFLEWFNHQDIPTRETIAFQVLYCAPDIDLENQQDLTNISVIFKQYLNKANTPAKIVGKLLYIKNAIDFIVAKYDNIDALIDSQNIINNMIKRGEVKGLTMDSLKKIHANGNTRYEIQSQFKKNWMEFCDDYLNFEMFEKYMFDNFLK